MSELEDFFTSQDPYKRVKERYTANERTIPYTTDGRVATLERQVAVLQRFLSAKINGYACLAEFERLMRDVPEAGIDKCECCGKAVGGRCSACHCDATCLGCFDKAEELPEGAQVCEEHIDCGLQAGHKVVDRRLTGEK